MIIDRIPFPRPDDPLMSARQRAADQAGGNGFMQVAATHAALLLAQGAGRLIRTTTDRGVVAVLDPRLVTARYGGFLKAQPAADVDRRPTRPWCARRWPGWPARPGRSAGADVARRRADRQATATTAQPPTTSRIQWLPVPTIDDAR